MPVAPQSTGSAISLTGNRLTPRLFLSEPVHTDPSQGADQRGSGGVGVDRGLLPRPCLGPHLEHLDPVAGAAGENQACHVKGCLVFQLYTFKVARRLALGLSRVLLVGGAF